ncbi:MAG: 50S ribosomal protein L22 [Chloroflexi bacterium]|nr:50S ribosomal protein L22 [Chloroflexota bacterium]MQF87215.1 50S ribosomal protein L22 [SAR202 cluster bacterium]|tara:strand:- start:1025 stop:1360 length:336 start_codon:yes stop_codon:yes gene_type:complete
MSVRATAKQIGVSPKKVRPLLRAIQGRPVSILLDELKFRPGSTAEEVASLLKSASANAENNDGLDPTRLVVVSAYANQAVKMRRFRARSRGRVGRVERQASHITIVVDEKG